MIKKNIKTIYIFEVGVIDRVNIKCKLPENNHTENSMPTTYNPKIWVWLNVDRDDPGGLSHKSVCPHPFTPEWEYCKKYKLENLAQLREYQLAVRNLEEDQI